MFRWSKSPAAPAASSGGEVAVQKVDKIEVRNAVTRPGTSRPLGGAEGDAFKRRVDEFIKQRKRGFHYS
ncbi:hypothetical protein PR202_gb24928 [Eleusine coracana subsp. coracana]|uniref:Uncharacterized protein n=1 Tax=Eleusine coracana subsp. coracana TaxID=191504 RepID=A0AAV5FMD7_ELECO|nr:hypothetical protein PR202_gb24928 [Eleusine coracana subsp. coracana]